MSTGAFRLLAKVQLGVAKGTVYDPGLAGDIGQGQMAKITFMTISNTDAADQPTKVYYTPVGVTAGAPEELVPNSKMLANEACFAYCEIALSYGDKIEGLAAVAGKVNVMLWGYAPTGTN